MSIADLSLFTSLGNSLDATATNIQQVEEQLASGKQVNQPSDNPTAYGGEVILNAQASAVANDLVLGQQVQSQLSTADGALSTVTNAIQSAISVATEGANGTVNAADMTALASQVQALQQQVIGAANAQYGGTFIFGGDQVQTPPYDAAGNYSGSAASNSVTFSDGTSVQTNFVGSAIFGNTSTGLIAAMANLATALNAGNQSAIATSLAQLQTALATVATAQGSIGGNETAANNVVTNAGGENVTLQTALQNLVGTDVPTAAMRQQEALLQQQALVSLGTALGNMPLINVLA